MKKKNVPMAKVNQKKSDKLEIKEKKNIKKLLAIVTNFQKQFQQMKVILNQQLNPQQQSQQENNPQVQLHSKQLKSQFKKEIVKGKLIPKQVTQVQDSQQQEQQNQQQEHPLLEIQKQKFVHKNQPQQKQQQSQPQEQQEIIDTGKYYTIKLENIPFQTQEDDITQFFQTIHKHIKNIDLLKGPNGKSKGIAKVNFKTLQAHNKALELNGQQIGGRSIKVISENINNKNRKQNKSANQNVNKQSTTAFIGKLNYSTTVDSLRNEFEQCGQIKDVRIVTDRQTGQVVLNNKSKGFGYVQFFENDSLQNALQKNGIKLDGKIINVDVASQRKKESKIRQKDIKTVKSFNNMRGGKFDKEKASKKGTIVQFQGKIQTL